MDPMRAVGLDRRPRQEVAGKLRLPAPTGSEPTEASRALTEFIVEALLTAIVGIAVGLVAALEVTYALVDVAEQTVQINDDWIGNAGASVAILYGVLLLVTLGASIGPALRASRLTPIEALRVVD